MSIDPKRVQSLFVAAADLPAAHDRAAYLDQACAGDAELRHRVDLAALNRAEEASDDYLLALDEALPRLAAEDTVAARVVELRFFAGQSREQIAEVLQLSVYAVRQKWNYARAWLQVAIQESPS